LSFFTLSLFRKTLVGNHQYIDFVIVPKLVNRQ
jgi:hypothetical protein